MASFNKTLGRWTVCVDGVTKYRYRHVMEEHLGRPLRTDEHVHHINGDRTDDRLENLEVLSPEAHGLLHAPTAEAVRARWEYEWSQDHACCVECGTVERPHTGHGECSRCYFRNLSRRKGGHAPRSDYAKPLTRECAWCGEPYESTTHAGVSVHCSRSCAARTIAKKAWETKRARQAAA